METCRAVEVFVQQVVFVGRFFARVAMADGETLSGFFEEHSAWLLGIVKAKAGVAAVEQVVCRTDLCGWDWYEVGAFILEADDGLLKPPVEWEFS